MIIVHHWAPCSTIQCLRALSKRALVLCPLPWAACSSANHPLVQNLALALSCCSPDSSMPFPRALLLSESRAQCCPSTPFEEIQLPWGLPSASLLWTEPAKEPQPLLTHLALWTLCGRGVFPGNLDNKLWDIDLIPSCLQHVLFRGHEEAPDVTAL